MLLSQPRVKRSADALHAPNMSVYWGGQQPSMHATTIHELGPYPSTLQIGDIQQMIFTKSDKGPFYVDQPLKQKHPKDTGKHKKLDKTKNDLLGELKKKKNYEVKHFMSLDDVKTVATKSGLTLTMTKKVITPGWCVQPKGLLQVLSERGWIDHSQLPLYSKSRKANQLDEYATILPKYEPFILQNLM